MKLLTKEQTAQFQQLREKKEMGRMLTPGAPEAKKRKSSRIPCILVPVVPETPPAKIPRPWESQDLPLPSGPIRPRISSDMPSVSDPAAEVRPPIPSGPIRSPISSDRPSVSDPAAKVRPPIPSGPTRPPISSDRPSVSDPAAKVRPPIPSGPIRPLVGIPRSVLELTPKKRRKRKMVLSTVHLAELYPDDFQRAKDD
ncbi:hypothetical protein O0L34_g9336 [Tuta absoluta]|nr:hypothetical protein O0L34_g9336 [Tuta absoluta]